MSTSVVVASTRVSIVITSAITRHLLTSGQASRLGDAKRGADHRAATHGVHERERVKGRGSDSQRAKPEVIADTIEVKRKSEHRHEHDTRRNGRAFEVLH